MKLYSGWEGQGRGRTEYFSYLEARSRLPGGVALPVDGRAVVGARWSEEEVAHLGFSSIVRRQFFEHTPEILGAEPPRPLDAEWRTDRAARLRQLFGVMPTSRIDLYAASASVAVGALIRELQLGGWFRITLSKAKAIGPGIPAFATVSDKEGEVRPAHVRQVLRVTQDEKRALRQVFSLDHIGDLGGEEPGPEPAPETPPSAPFLLAEFKALKPGRIAVVFGRNRLQEAKTYERDIEPIEVVERHYRFDSDAILKRGLSASSDTPRPEEA
ncbi:MAG: hypothetical protein P0Y50_14965 [Candidatus Brevundimonas colombiensis]|uniref:Uncharacterized protein n=1 Tax=Candidatus Brevundimonas colombiensis TaxID=3121376 RepID=A0AAJ6BJG3_9CAUL|nr:hypothetical protein [Brevundimonas sp.]WEK39815.1 MAG: hypothetical protein P0Y50_14965 [Brevundimonas sp.]